MKEYIDQRRRALAFPRERIREAHCDMLAARRQVLEVVDDARVHQTFEDMPGGASAMEVTVQGLLGLRYHLDEAAKHLKAAFGAIDQVSKNEADLYLNVLRMMACHCPERLTAEELNMAKLAFARRGRVPALAGMIALPPTGAPPIVGILPPPASTSVEGH